MILEFDEYNELKEKKNSSHEKTKKGKSVPKKYLTKNKKAMKKEIDEFRGKDNYKTEWDADYKSAKGGKGKRHKTKKSTATKAYEKQFGKKEDIVLKFNEFDIINETSGSVDNKDSSAYKALKKKSEDSGISLTILKQVYKKGMAAWNSGHRPGTPQNAWAMGRVNSFITGSGGARKADADLWKKAKEQKKKKKK